VGCGDDAAPADAGATACFVDASADAGVICVDGGPCEVLNACDSRFWRSGPLPTPWWLDHPPSACLDHVTHGSCEWPEALDDCQPSPVNFVPSACPVPSARAATCAETDFWTQTCHTSADCPRGMGCVDSFGDGPLHDADSTDQGLCRQLCGGSGAPICVRCADVCADEGYCKPAPPPLGHACRADCECMGGEVCAEGHCQLSGVPYNSGICGSQAESYPADLRCACTHGSCAADPRTGQNCCYLPDGGVARGGADCN
jgi:hypothetical protein